MEEKSRIMLSFGTWEIRKIMEPPTGKVNKGSRCDERMMELALEMLSQGLLDHPGEV